MTGDDEFRRMVEPYRQELQLHCYRMLGSLHDAEDALQETLLAAWQGLGGFEGRSSLRAWLYRIATNRCLNMLRAQRRRPATSPDMHSTELPEPSRLGEVLWLEPYPDAFLEGLAEEAPGPDSRYETHEAITLAFMAALKLLPARQRAVLILRDVLGYHAREVARMLESTEESVTSALKRARATMGRSRAASPPPPPGVEAEVVDRFTRAFESGDLGGLVALLTRDVVFSMPPLPFEWDGPERAAAFFRAMWTAAPERRLVATRANGAPAFGLYLPDPSSGVYRAMGLLVLTLAGSRIAAITRFENGVLADFGLPRTLPVR